jgi:hypothetical protein
MLGGLMKKKGGDAQSANIERFRKEDLEANRENYATQLRDSRFDRSNPFQNVSWTEGPDGKWTQESKFAPEQQGLFDKQNSIRAARMAAATGQDLSRYSKGIDYNAMGLGHLAQAAGAGPGTTGKRPWADSPWASAGGEYLNYMSGPPGGMQHPLSMTPWNVGGQSLPAGGGALMRVGDVADKLKMEK